MVIIRTSARVTKKDFFMKNKFSMNLYKNPAYACSLGFGVGSLGLMIKESRY
jgi:hypothetical protein